MLVLCIEATISPVKEIRTALALAKEKVKKAERDRKEHQDKLKLAEERHEKKYAEDIQKK